MGGRYLLDKMAAPAMVLMGRAARTLNMTSNYTSSSGYSQAATDRNDNATLNLISNLVFAESKSVRTSTIILAAFNVLAAFTTAASILYDCYWASKRCNPKFKASKFCVSAIHPAETFPLVLSIGIVIQGLVFAGVQGEGLESLFTKGCREIAQFQFPALFIVPYIQLVFGLECAFRSLRALPFQARGKWDVTICLGTILVMLILTWLPTHIFPEQDACFASLVWFVTRYGKLGFILFCITGGLMIISALTIFTRLSAVNLIDEHQRIAASRMVYYLVLGIVSLAFVIPYFFSLIGRQGDIKLAMMATVVLNLSGLMSGLLQLFLRSNTSTTSFGPKAGRSWDRGKHEIRIFGPNELAMRQHLANPVTGPGNQRGLESRATSLASLVGPEKRRDNISMDSLRSPIRSPKYFDEIGSMPEISPSKAASRGHAKKPSYSLFPGAGESSSPTKPLQQPISIYDISDLTPPPQIHYTSGPRHRRDSSIASSATVQIGLRLSHAPMPSKDDIENLPVSLPSTTYNSNATSNTLSPGAGLALPATTYSATPKAKALNRPNIPLSPLKVQTSFLPTSPPPRSSRRPQPSPLYQSTSNQASSPTQSLNKTLPPTPKAFLPAVEKVRESNSNLQLSPTVYTPAASFGNNTGNKLGVRIGAGLGSVSGGPRSATLLKNGPLRLNPLGSPSANGVGRSNSGRYTPVAPAPMNLGERQKAKDWI